jgi:hypothetical protein
LKKNTIALSLIRDKPISATAHRRAFPSRPPAIGVSTVGAFCDSLARGRMGQSMVSIGQRNVSRIAERIVANELEARGFRVSDLNKEGVAVNADLLAVSSNQTLQVQVKGSANSLKERWWIGYGYFKDEFISDGGRMFNCADSFYKANIVVFVAVKSPTEYSCIVMPVDKAEQAVALHRAGFKEKGYPHGRTHMWLEPPPRAPETSHIIKERKLLARYRDEQGWARLLQSKRM